METGYVYSMAFISPDDAEKRNEENDPGKRVRPV
jgi:hypothetical protein